MEFSVDVAAPYRLRAWALGPVGAPPPLVTGAEATATTWPPARVDRLAARHRVITYAQVGRSTGGDVGRSTGGGSTPEGSTSGGWGPPVGSVQG
ncbi:hypothetical protein O7606_22420 [Micromonospora sp. WMMD882]|uniref:hypothetical protein n=1 Tax=Micromonospora sp. WMMD882 TaxID=3015151 RepID=UPI00248B2B12|nr:hypothetical protein [Micromonospora sp. WMMD882]WBB78921.1 hypothetical protein O7606_22420 [Micromonospora sp. WMMD882]